METKTAGKSAGSLPTPIILGRDNNERTISHGVLQCNICRQYGYNGYLSNKSVSFLIRDLVQSYFITGNKTVAEVKKKLSKK